MYFDKLDFDDIMSRNGVEKGYDQMKSIILHEMCVGSMNTLKCGNLCNQNVTDMYKCGKAKTKFYYLFDETEALHLSSATGTCGHWTENSFKSKYKSKLMTSYFDPNKRNPLSTVSVAFLTNLGYEVNINAADPWLINKVEEQEYGQLNEEGETYFSTGKVIKL